MTHSDPNQQTPASPTCRQRLYDATLNYVNAPSLCMLSQPSPVRVRCKKHKRGHSIIKARKSACCLVTLLAVGCLPPSGDGSV